MRHALFTRATMRLLILAVILWSAFWFIPQAHAATITITSCPTGTSLHNTVNSAAPGDTIQFSISGSPCTIDLSGSGGGTLSITKNLTFSASGSPQSVTLSGGLSFQVLQVTSGNTFTLQNITIANGLVSGDGGGIDNIGGTVTISNSTISNNSSSNGGGIFNTSSGTVTISNSTISNNSISNSSSNNSGGGIFNDYSSTMTISNSTISSNTGPNSGFSDDGGGIYNHGTVTINKSTISSNAINFGGGIFNADSGTVTINQSTVANNASASSGGGIYNGDGNTLTVSQSTFANNSAFEGGGIFNAGTLTFSTGTIANNTVTSSNGGGGIINYTTPIFSSKATISNSTVANNSPTGGGGGGIVNLGGTVGIAQSIVANNGSINCAGPITDQSYNLESGTDCGLSGPTDQQNTNPQFQGGLQNNGGPTQTIALKPTSPAVNSIPVNTGYGCITGSTDQRGLPRPDRFLLLLPETTCDIGAYEVQGELLQ